MDEKMKNYILDNHDKYGIHNEKGELLSRQEMEELLEILELFNENLDTFHDVAFQGGDVEFCGVWGSRVDDDDTYKSVIDFHQYIAKQDINRFMLDILDNYICDTEENEQNVDDFKEYFDYMYLYDSLDIVKGGLVHHVWC